MTLAFRIKFGPDMLERNCHLKQGVRLSRRFRLSDRVSDVLDFVESCEMRPPFSCVQVCVSYPKRELSRVDGSSTLEVVGIASQRLIWVDIS